MREQVVIDVIQKGADVAADQLEELAANADKASIKVDALTGKYKAQYETLDKTTGVMRKVTVEDGKLTSATETLTKSVAKNDNAVKTITNSYQSFGRTLGQFAAAAGVLTFLKSMTQEIVTSVGAITQANVALRSYFTTQQQFIAVSAIFNSAIGNSAAQLQNFTGAFGTLRASADLTRISSETLATTLVNASNAIRAGGATAKEAATGVDAFAKAMEDGRITGAEFGDIMAKYPELARAIATETGMSAETIRTLGLSADTAAAALNRAAESLKRKAEANQTVGDKVTELITKLAEYLIKVDNATGATDALKKVLGLMADNIDKLVPAVFALIGAWASYRTAVVIATTATAILNGTLAGGIMGTIIKLIGLLATAAGAWYAYYKAQNSEPAKTPTAPGANGGTLNSLGSTGGNSSANNPNRSAADMPTVANNQSMYQNSFGQNDTVANSVLTQRDGNVIKLSGERASGGPVKAGGTYLVGEDGPELFRSASSGSIISNDNMGGGATPQKALDMLVDAFTQATEAPFTVLSDLGRETTRLLGEIVEWTKSTSSSASALVSATQGGALGATASGTSNLNNFGIEYAMGGAVSQAAPASSGGGGGSNFPAYAATGGGGGGAIASVGSFVAKLMDLNERYVNNNWLAGRDAPSTKFALQALQAYIQGLPGDVKEEVLAQGRLKRGQVMPGYPIAFRSGGGFTVPGSTGVDSKLVQMRVTPGEEVDVRTRKQRREEMSPDNSGNGGNTFVFNIETQDADSFRRSERQVLRDFTRKIVQANGRS